MTSQKIRFTFILLSFLHLSTLVKAQFSASIGPGLTSYSGDVSGVELANTRPALVLDLWHQMNRHLYIKSGIGIYQIYATDIYPERNRDFRATNLEVYTSLMVGANPDRRLMPFAYVGVGISTNSPQYAVPNDNDTDYLDAKSLNTEDEIIPGAFVILPIGAGLRFKINENLAIIADAGLRLTNTDLLDGVSTASIDVATLSTEAANYFEAIRPNGIDGATTIGNGNPDLNDVYGIFSIKLQFRLNGTNNTKGIPCPPFYGR